MRTRRPRYGRLIAYFSLSIVFGSIAGLSIPKYGSSKSRRESTKSENMLLDFGSRRPATSPARALSLSATGVHSFFSSLWGSGSADEELTAEAIRAVHQLAALPVSLKTELPAIQPATVSHDIVHEVRAGETLAGILKRYEVECGVADSAIQILGSLTEEHTTLRQGETLELTMNPAVELHTLVRHRSDGSMLFVSRGANGSFRGELREPTVEESVRRVAGVITKSLAATADDLDIPYEVVDDVVDQLASRIRFDRDIKVGDRFAVIYSERRRSDGKLIGTGPIQAALITQGGEPRGIIRQVDKEGKEFYFDEKGKPLGESFLRYPVQFTRISSMFSKARFHPVLNVHKPHNGVDFAAPSGTPVRTIGDGTVTFAGYSKSAGYVVRVQHNDRYSTEYLHLSKIDRSVKQGCRVTRGQLIGSVGSTGLATGPHLHFGLFDKGVYRDPLSVEYGDFGSVERRLSEQVLARTLDDLVGLSMGRDIAVAQVSMTDRQPPA